MQRIAVRLASIGLACTMATVAYAGTVGPNEVKFEDGAVNASLTGVAGNAGDGKKWFVGRKLGNCLACHENSDAKDEPFHGEVGPSLDGAGDRWSEAELRGIISNSKMMFEDTIMPAFYNTTNAHRPLEKFEGKTILSAQQVEDIVAYLLTLKE